jgi:hypothetical protein
MASKRLIITGSVVIFPERSSFPDMYHHRTLRKAGKIGT